MTTQAEEFVQGLRDLADQIEKHPVLARGCVTLYEWFSLPGEAGAFRDALAALGDATKDDFTASSFAGLSRRFGPHTLSVYADRAQVCTRRQVGWTNEVVEVKTNEIADNEEPIDGTEAWVRTVKVTRKTPKFETTCPESLLARATELAAGQ